MTDHIYEEDIDLPLRVRITYTSTPGAPAEGPSYWSGGTPASADEVDVSEVQIRVAGYWYLLPKAAIVNALIEGHCIDEMVTQARDEADS